MGKCQHCGGTGKVFNDWFCFGCSVTKSDKYYKYRAHKKNEAGYILICGSCAKGRTEFKLQEWGKIERDF